MAVRIVLRSRISPTRITSGSCRNDATKASLKLLGIDPDLALFTRLRSGACRYSIGSSMVTMWQRRSG